MAGPQAPRSVQPGQRAGAAQAGAPAATTRLESERSPIDYQRTSVTEPMLGQVKLDTTQIYTQVSIRKLKEIHEATHPARMEREKSKDDHHKSEESS